MKAILGPAYATPAEIRMARAWGGETADRAAVDFKKLITEVIINI